MNNLNKSISSIIDKITVNNFLLQDYKSIFNEFGVIIYRNLFNIEIINNLKKQFDSVFSDKEKIVKFRCPQGVGAPENVFNLSPSFLSSNTLSNLFKEVKKDDHLFQFLTFFFNGDFFTGKTNVISTHRTAPSLNPEKHRNWHSDNASFLWKEKFRCLTFWTPLTAAGPDSAPGLRLCAKKFNHNLFNYTNDQSIWDGFEKNYQNYFILPTVSPGDCIIFDSFTLHGTGFTHEQKSVRDSLDFRFLSCAHHPPVNSEEEVFASNNQFSQEIYSDLIGSNFIEKKINFIKKKLKKLLRINNKI